METYHASTLLLIIILTGCSSTPSIDVESYYFRQGTPNPTAMSFTHCYDYGCKHKASITLNDQNWQGIYAQFEKTVKPIAGTDEDVRSSFLKPGKLQHDCADESINTTTYMALLQDNGYIPPSHRMLLNGLPGWPHQTATLIKKTSNKFIVDSWFRDNGYPSFIVTLKAWRFG